MAKHRPPTVVLSHSTYSLIPTTENWAPSFDIDGCHYFEGAGGFAQLRAHFRNGKLWRLCVSGGDDTLMELDGNDGHLNSILRRIPSVITFKSLLELGFHFA